MIELIWQSKCVKLVNCRLKWVSVRTLNLIQQERVLNLSATLIEESWFKLQTKKNGSAHNIVIPMDLFSAI